MTTTKSPWQDNAPAFEIMFDDVAEFTLVKTNERGTIHCCVFAKEEVDPFVESDNESLIMAATVLVQKCDWHFTTDRPAIGDKVKLPNGDVYKIYNVTPEQNWFKLDTRSVCYANRKTT